jgi:hypothetical protein
MSATDQAALKTAFRATQDDRAEKLREWQDGGSMLAAAMVCCCSSA